MTVAIDAAVALTAHEHQQRGRVLVSHAGPAYVLGSEGRLCQIFVNLLLNAAHGLGSEKCEDNEVRVSSRVDGSAVDVEIRDSGCGIPADLLPRVFEPFFTTKTSGEGSGLGLAICRDLVTALRGDIAIESRVGVGTCVRVRLPLAEAALGAAAQGPASRE